MADTCICPYDNNHIVKHTRFVNHLLKCGKQNPDVVLFRCALNHAHLVPEELMQAHFQNCPDALSSWRLKYQDGRNYLRTVIVEASETQEPGIAAKETPDTSSTKVKNWLERTDGVLHGSHWDDDVNVAHKVSRETFCPINGHHSERHSDVLKKDTDELYPSNEGSLTPSNDDLYLEVAKAIMASPYNPKSASREAKQLKDSELSSVVSFPIFADEQDYASVVCAAVSEIDDSSEDAIPIMDIICGNQTMGKKDSRKGGGMYLDELAKRKARLCDALKKIELKTTLQANVPVLRNHLQATSQAEPGSSLGNEDGVKHQEDTEPSLDSFIGTNIMINQGKIHKAQLMSPVGISHRHVSIGTQKNESFTVNTSQSFSDDEHEVVSSDDDSGNEWKNRSSLLQQQNAPETLEGASSFADGESTFSYTSREELNRDAEVDTASTASHFFSVDGRKISFSSEGSGTKARTSLLKIIESLKKSPKRGERESCKVSGTKTRPDLSLLKTVASLKEAADHCDNESLFEDAESTVSLSSTAGQLSQSARKKWNNEAMDNAIKQNMDNDEGAKFNIAPSTSQVVINDGSHNGSSSCEDLRPKARTGRSLLGIIASLKKAAEHSDNETVFEDAKSTVSLSSAGQLGPSQTNGSNIEGDCLRHNSLKVSCVRRRLELHKLPVSCDAESTYEDTNSAVGCESFQDDQVTCSTSSEFADSTSNEGSGKKSWISLELHKTTKNTEGVSVVPHESVCSWQKGVKAEPAETSNNVPSGKSRTSLLEKIKLHKSQYNCGAESTFESAKSAQGCSSGDEVTWSIPHEVTNSVASRRSGTSLLEKIALLKASKKSSTEMTFGVESTFESAKSAQGCSAADKVTCSTPEVTNSVASRRSGTSLLEKIALLKASKKSSTEMTFGAESTFESAKSAQGCSAADKVTCSTPEVTNSVASRRSGTSLLEKIALLKASKKSSTEMTFGAESTFESAKSAQGCSAADKVTCSTPEVTNSVASRRSGTSLLEKIALLKASKKSSTEMTFGAESTFESAKSAQGCSAADKVTCSTPEVTNSVASRRSGTSLLEKCTSGVETTSENVKPDRLACNFSLELKSSASSVAKSSTSLLKELSHKQSKNNSDVESILKANQVDLLPNFSNNEADVNEINDASLTTVNPSDELVHGCDNESAMDDAMSSVSCSRFAGGRINHITRESNSFGQHSLTKDRLKKFEDMQGNCKSTLSPPSKFLDNRVYAPEFSEGKPLLSKFLRELRPSADDFNAASVASGASSFCSSTKLVPNHSTANSNFSISGIASKKTQSSAKYDKIVPRKWHALYRNFCDNEIDYETCLCPKCT